MHKKLQPYETEIKTLGFYINRLLFTLHKKQTQLLHQRGLDLQASEFIVLRVINELKGVSQSELAVDMGRERSGISRILSSLEKKELISRTPINKKNYYIKLTEKGEQLSPVLPEISEELTDLAFKGFSKKNQEVMLCNLHKIYLNVL